jgi:hypothetical protein
MYFLLQSASITALKSTGITTTINVWEGSIKQRAPNIRWMLELLASVGVKEFHNRHPSLNFGLTTEKYRSKQLNGLRKKLTWQWKSLVDCQKKTPKGSERIAEILTRKTLPVRLTTETTNIITCKYQNNWVYVHVKERSTTQDPKHYKDQKILHYLHAGS